MVSLIQLSLHLSMHGNDIAPIVQYTLYPKWKICVAANWQTTTSDKIRPCKATKYCAVLLNSQNERIPTSVWPE